MESMRTVNLVLSAALFLAAVLTFSGAVGQVIEPRRLLLGDDIGWKLGFDYAAWAGANPIMVTDILVFKYDNTSHTLARFNTKGECDACNFTSLKSNRASDFSHVMATDVTAIVGSEILRLHHRHAQQERNEADGRRPAPSLVSR